MTQTVPRVGCVPYLNARPLLEGLPFPVRKIIPAQLCDVFQSGELDVALLSSIDVISKAHAEVVDGVSIASKGDVYSVVMAYTGELLEVTEVALDPASHTSNALLRIILEEFVGIQPDYVQLQEGETISTPSLMIGDRAISFRRECQDPGVKFLDLGGEWYRYTGLPFIFALWELKKENTEKKYISEAIRAAKIRGLGVIEEIASREADPDFARTYLREHIRYDLGDEEKRGLALFGDYLQKLNIANSNTKSEIYY